MIYSLDTPINKILGIGPKFRNIFESMDIFTVENLLMHIPFRYEDRTKVSKISHLYPETEATIYAYIKRIDNLYTKRGFRLTKAKIYDETGEIEAIWFNQQYIVKSLKPGTYVKFFGKITTDGKHLTVSNPDWEIIGDVQELDSQTGELVPIYYTTEGLSQKWLRKKIKEVIANTKILEYFDSEFLNKYDLINNSVALNKIHCPQNEFDITISKRTLGFNELFWLHLRGIKIRSDWNLKNNSRKIILSETDKNEYLSLIPFKLTNSQIRSIDEIISDLQLNVPMNRMLQGDVGSGKTLVAEVAIFACIKSGYNAVFLAPTQILANQHYNKLQSRLDKLGYEISLLTSETKIIKETNKPHLIISTHAILHNLNKFGNVGLIIIDEQHKFGVAQRSKIIEYYSEQDIVPNLLTMTATPIPRSLALTIYGDLELSTIDELPSGRKGIKTTVVEQSQKPQVYKWIEKEVINSDNQAFIVCPFIHESEVEMFKNVKSAEKEFVNLKKIFPNLKIGLLHGKINEKEKIIEDFRHKKISILVTTPVVEVGVDIPNANIMVIESAERFGLASLHQLRGRVGRGEEEGHCLIFAENKSSAGYKRIKYMETIFDGNKLAEIDLKLRGPGNIYGLDQHGFLDLKIADITDSNLVRETKETANQIFNNIEEYPIIKKRLMSHIYIDDQ